MSATPTAPPSLEDQIKPISEIPGPFKGMIYGPPGTGKTTLCAHLPNVLYVDTSKRETDVLRKYPHLRETVRVLKLQAFEDILTLFWELKAGKYSWCETVVIDTFSELQRRHLDDLLRKAHTLDPTRNAYLPLGKDNQENSETLRRVAWAFTELDNKNLIIVAHHDEKMDANNLVHVRPMISPKLLGTMFGLLSFIAYMGKEFTPDGQIRRYLITDEVIPRVMAKSRLAFEDFVIYNPSFQHILDAQSRGETTPVVGMPQPENTVQIEQPIQPTEINLGLEGAVK